MASKTLDSSFSQDFSKIKVVPMVFICPGSDERIELNVVDGKVYSNLKEILDLLEARDFELGIFGKYSYNSIPIVSVEDRFGFSGHAIYQVYTGEIGGLWNSPIDYYVIATIPKEQREKPGWEKR